MAPKKKMNLSELGVMFGANPNKGVLPSRSEGKEEQRGFRGRDRDGGGKGGGFGGDDGGWRDAGDRRGGGDRGGFDRREEGDTNWRSGLRGPANRDSGFGGRDRDGPRGGFGRDRDGGGGGADWKDLLRSRNEPEKDKFVPPSRRTVERSPDPSSPDEDETNTPPPEEKKPARAPKVEKEKPEPKKKKEAPPPKVVAEKPVDHANEALIEKFSESLEKWAAKPSDCKALITGAKKVLTSKELESPKLAAAVAGVLLQAGRGHSEEECTSLVEKAKPLLEWVWECDPRAKPKLHFLFELQAAAYGMGLPRLSPATALVEAFFDALYMLDIIEEGYFHLWKADTEDEHDGKIDTMFSVTTWFTWLETAKVEGEDSSDEDESGSGSDSDSDESDD